MAALFYKLFQLHSVFVDAGGLAADLQVDADDQHLAGSRANMRHQAGFWRTGGDAV